MKIKTIITDIERDDIVSLLSTALYGNAYMAATYSKKAYNSLTKEQKQGECFEEKCADLLFAGKEIIIFDCDADGILYTKAGVKCELDEDNMGIYYITLENIKKGLALDEVKQDLVDFLEENEHFYTGYNLLQAICFGEIIYG